MNIKVISPTRTGGLFHGSAWKNSTPKGDSIFPRTREVEFVSSGIWTNHLGRSHKTCGQEAVKEWRELGYPGASGTTQQLLAYWFERSHRLTDGAGGEMDFRYYFCQREAIETFIYLIEVRAIRTLSGMLESFAGPTGELQASGP
jgi:hypothetical protein